MIEWEHSKYTVELKDNGKIYLTAMNADNPEQCIIMEFSSDLAGKIAEALIVRVMHVEASIYDAVERIINFE